ncbi:MULTISPECIES: hypothetical protein [unclassified Bradyrhizobium]|uniref:hypothetical protein n=1 Tax=unclassified Bradyrhizobium TaxID=2631580 RepID=UPI001FF7AC61|nr:MULTISPECIES: hypothetical protein [unclassified Bradyrhizobium]MCK1421518.1 hypothetical protein [Bradyrhizobium sp. CW12]MCK1645642.1 hypothetical protein [Bradyrhizobium sp. 154]
MAETAKSLIAKSWKKTRVRKPKRGVAAIYAGHAIILNNKLTSVAFQNHLELYDEFVSWLADVATVLLYSDASLQREDYAYAHLASAICSLALSLRHAVCIGHDVSAKILARSLAEYSDVMALLIVRPDLRTEFQNEEAPEQFWQKHVQRGKARRSVLAALPLEGRALDWSTQYEAFRREEGKFLSTSVHPSYVSAAMTVLAVDDEKVAWPGFLGRVTDASVRTLVYAMQCLSLVVFLSRLPFGSKKSEFSVGLTFEPKNKLHRQIEARRYVLIRILRFLGTQASEKGVFKVKDRKGLKKWAQEELGNKLPE